MNAKSESLEDQQHIWFEQAFWPLYWRKVDKKPAFVEFKKHARTVDQFQQIISAVKEHSPYYHLREPQMRPHAATWLNKKRYLEPFDASLPQITVEKLSKKELSQQEAEVRFMRDSS